MKTIFLFPGQGAQTVGMGLDLYDHHIIYKQTFDMCEQGAGLDLKAACFEGERMDESEVVQPAIFAHSVSLLRVLQSEGYDADIYAGLSLGEYTALTAADVFSAAQCAALVRQRGRIMDYALPKGEGGMLSVIGFDIGQVRDVIKDYDGVSVSNHLSELQVVIGGKMDDLKKLEQVFISRGAKMVGFLNVRGPSHTPMLAEAADTFMYVLKGVEAGSMQKPVYSNVMGMPYDNGTDIKATLAKQMCTIVKWHGCVEHMVESGIERYVEIGPSNVLTKLVKRRAGKDALTVSVRDLPTLEKFLSENNE
ncbi:MAG: ACP S-malonyltransferase [Eubacteriales bacterium]|nr:ACP S-malonyltransferase [Eubacteriales bacterium]